MASRVCVTCFVTTLKEEQRLGISGQPGTGYRTRDRGSVMKKKGKMVQQRLPSAAGDLQHKKDHGG